MRFIINTSVIISALMKRKSLGFYVILKTKHELYIPEHAVNELLEHIREIEEESELSTEEIYLRLILIAGRLNIVPRNDILKCMKEAERIIGHRDEKDVPFVATLLAIHGDGVVSYDNDFEEIEKHGYRWLKPSELIRGKK